LDTSEVASIFGSEVTPKSANKLLKVIHGRRIAGTLEDPAHFPKTDAESLLHTNALEYLRENYPIDEIAAAGRRAEEELRILDDELVQDSTRLGLFKPQSGVKDDNVYGESGLEAIRQEYKRRRAVEEEKEEMQKQKTGGLQQVEQKVVLRMYSHAQDQGCSCSNFYAQEIPKRVLS